MAQEIELKLLCDRKSVPALGRKLAALGGKRARAITLINTYFDTPDFALAKRQIALRVRKAGSREVQTVKTSGTVRAGLSSRMEWDAPWGGSFDFSAVEDAALREWLEAQREHIVPLFSTRFKRVRWQLEFAGALIEAALDDGAVEAGAYHEPIHELELELQGGPAKALTRLQQALSEVAPLVPENLSKAERGYRLIQAGVIKPSSHKRRIKPDSRDDDEMDLLIWRHAEAQDGSPDESRALTDRGEKQAARVARWLRAHQPRKLRVLVSPARRTVQTAQAFTDDFQIDRRLAPGASAAEVLAATGWPQASGAVLVVGHQPTLGRLAALLLGGDEADWSVKKGALWWFSRRLRNGETRTVLRAVISPDLLAD